MNSIRGQTPSPQSYAVVTADDILLDCLSLGVVSDPQQGGLPMPAAQACIPCRRRKIKCTIESGQAKCNNCLIGGRAETCYMLKSRRGGRLKKVPVSSERQIDGCSASSVATTYAAPPSSTNIVICSTDITDPSNDSAQELITAILRISCSDILLDGSEQVALNEYYTSFHVSHPFLPPMSSLLLALRCSECPELLNSMLSIGYRLLLGNEFSQAELHAGIAKAAIVRYGKNPSMATIHIAQLFLLQSLLSFACGDKREGASLLTMTCDLIFTSSLYPLAQSIPANTISTTDMSLLRTIWEIWMCDVMFATLLGKSRGACHLSAEALNLATPVDCYSADDDTRKPRQFIGEWSHGCERRDAAYAHLIAAFDLLREVIALVNSPNKREESSFCTRLDDLDLKLTLLKSSVPLVLDTLARINWINFRTHMVFAGYVYITSADVVGHG